MRKGPMLYPSLLAKFLADNAEIDSIKNIAERQNGLDDRHGRQGRDRGDRRQPAVAGVARA